MHTNKTIKISIETDGKIHSLELDRDSHLDEYLMAFQIMLLGAGFQLDKKKVVVQDETEEEAIE